MRRLASFTTGFALVAFAGFLGAVPVAASSVLEVPIAFPTIQAAINAAVNGDTVLVDPGTYVENIDFKGKLITVQSAKGPSVTTIDGGNVAPVVNFSTSETAAAVLQGFTIQHGNATATFGYEGAGVHINSASPTVEGNVITANVSCADGAGISIAFASPVIRDTTINGNSKQPGCSGQGGGGIYVRGAAGAQIIHNTITNNSSDFGGGIDLFAAGTPTLLNNTISNNTAGIQGGGIYAVNQSDAM
ncbi:MAG TPA: right-handed parallel beta-helix repeat-containing protein, partial [Candidatus Dormibacteraeota bacterium]|nr:right-handed parallel beta-helix repeat-containing protein [Candidatus Dormibacteraeota bacterium]